ncbi:hypothetical protein [Thiolapillus sp.]
MAQQTYWEMRAQLKSAGQRYTLVSLVQYEMSLKVGRISSMR